MAKRKHATKMYEAAEHWRDNCLVKDGSMFGGKTLWSRENFETDFEKRFVDFLVPSAGDEEAGKSALVQWRGFLEAAGAPTEIFQLMAEVVWVADLADGHTGAPAKKQRIQYMAEATGAKLPTDHAFLQDEYMKGTAKLGPGFAVAFWFELLMLIFCVREIKRMDPSARERLLVGKDGKELSRLWDAWPEKWRAGWSHQWTEHFDRARRKYQPQSASIRHIMMHLLFPEHYEPVFSSGHKRKIVRAFTPRRPLKEKMSWTEVDETIQAIRKDLEKTHGTPLEFYQKPFRQTWLGKPAGKVAKDEKDEKDEIEKEVNEVEESMMNIPLNQIFYGPPGTGKTYHTVNAALEILDNEFYQANKDDRQSLKNRFDELKQGGQIGVVTFHQSFGYEEFVEGIRPMMAEGEDETVAYEIKSGIFKDLCQRAQSPRPAFEFDEAIEKLKKDCTENPVALRTTVKGSEFTITYRGGKTFRFKTYKTESPKTKSPSDSERDDPVNIEHIKKVYRGANPYEFYNSPYLLPIVNYVKEKYGIGDSAGDGGQGISHVLIIDEINRGNISRIFGELITLIEESKRVGNAEAIEVALPYSGDTFGVPNNLYIIGTMNTADRSIALLDTALRRRFRFVEMMPKPKLLAGIDVDGIKIQNLLAAMNEHIEALYDRDHQIGHSFFLRLENNSSIETLADIFEHEILPLLQEYFYDDWEKIDLVLNRNKFLAKKDPPKMPDGAVADDRKIWDTDKDRLEEALKDPANYQKIYADAADDNAA